MDDMNIRSSSLPERIAPSPEEQPRKEPQVGQAQSFSAKTWVAAEPKAGAQGRLTLGAHRSSWVKVDIKPEAKDTQAPQKALGAHRSMRERVTHGFTKGVTKLVNRVRNVSGSIFSRPTLPSFDKATPLGGLQRSFLSGSSSRAQKLPLSDMIIPDRRSYASKSQAELNNMGVLRAVDTKSGNRSI